MKRKYVDSSTKILAIHLWQPWADLIAIGAKTIETRTRNIKYRGPVIICATMKLNPEAKKAIEVYQSDIWEGGPLLPQLYAPRLGVAVCTANLVDSKPLTEADREAACYADHWPLEYQSEGGKDKGKWLPIYGWHLEGVTPIKPFELKGRQSPFETLVMKSKLQPALLLELPTRKPAKTNFILRQMNLF